MTTNPTDRAARAAAREKAARALCVSRGLGPDTLHQVHEPPFDQIDARGTMYIYGWRKQLPHADAAIDAYRAALPPVDDVVTQLYRRFKDWSKRGFGPDDVTWCEVKADVEKLIAAVGSANVEGDREAMTELAQDAFVEGFNDGKIGLNTPTLFTNSKAFAAICLRAKAKAK